MKNVSLRQLNTFLEAAKSLNFARAAERLHLTPPAVTLQMKELEAAVGVKLFDRRGKHLSLTTGGEYLLVYAKRVAATLREAEDALAKLQRLESGSLTVGMVSTAKYFVPHLLARFRQLHPHIEVRLRVGNNREHLVSLLQSSEIDLAIMGRAPKGLATRAEAFAGHPHVFVGPPDHPLLNGTRVPAERLADYAFIVREEASGTRAAMQSFFAERDLNLRVLMEMPSNESIKQAVMAGMGLSFLSLHTLWLELRSGLLQVLPVQGSPLMRTWNVVRVLPRTLSPAAEAFRQFILREGETYLLSQDRAWVDHPGEPGASFISGEGDSR